MRFPISALVVAVMLTRATASSAEIAAERNDRGGLRKGNRRRKLQNRSIICEAQECTGCTVNGLCLPTGAQWVLTEGSCNRRCVCFNKDQSGEYRCAPCPQSFAASTPAVPATELNNNNNNDAQEEGDGGAASASAESSRVVPGFGTVGEEDGGGLFSEEDIIMAELDILNQPLLPP